MRLKPEWITPSLRKAVVSRWSRERITYFHGPDGGMVQADKHAAFLLSHMQLHEMLELLDKAAAKASCHYGWAKDSLTDMLSVGVSSKESGPEYEYDDPDWGVRKTSDPAWSFVAATKPNITWRQVYTSWKLAEDFMHAIALAIEAMVEHKPEAFEPSKE